MASRFGSNLHQRDARSALFGSYDTRASSQSPHSGPGGRSSPAPGGYGLQPAAAFDRPASANGPYSSSGSSGFGAYPGAGGGGAGSGVGSTFRAATPNKKGQYSDAVLNELESQNEEEVGALTGKVRMLKDLTVAIGDEIRDSSALAEKMNDSFDSTRVRLRGTMNRMLRMAEKTGIPWKAWLAFFAAVIFLFWYVWL